MATTLLPYAPEFRRHMVALARAGRSPEQLAGELEPTAVLSLPSDHRVPCGLQV